MLERSHRPDSVGFVPEYDADYGAEADDKEVFAAETLQEKRQVRHVEDGAENRVKEIPWKEELTKFHVMAEHTDFNLTNQHVVPANFLLLHQT